MSLRKSSLISKVSCYQPCESNGTEEAQPSDEEKEIHGAVAAVLDKGPRILDKLFKYEGCEEFIRKVKLFFFGYK